VLTIDDLPDDDLLEIFDFYVVRYQDLCFHEFGNYEIKRKIESWQSLVHVCRRWRGLVFASPRRLNLHLYYIPGTAERKSLDVWPALPLLIKGYVSETSVNGVIAELEYCDRICQIDLYCYTASQTEKLWTAMQVSFPELTVLRLWFGHVSAYVPVLPDSFLGGSAPRLRYFYLDAIPFPGLPRLLLSATHLVNLHLYEIPHSGYISPEAMATSLSMLTSLESLQLDFVSPLSYFGLKSRRPFPPTRSVLPTLTNFRFEGLNEYLEDLVSRIDAPRLYRLLTTFFDDIDFDTPELNQLISRTPTFGAYNEARLIFSSHEARVRLQSHPGSSDHGMVEVNILCQVPDRQLSSLAQICTSSLRLLLTMENLYIHETQYFSPNWKDDIKNTEWLDFLLPFTAVKNLYISKAFSPCIAPALRELTGPRTTEVLPALQNVLLEEFQPSKPVHEGIGQFISARQLTNHPVAISVWDRDKDLVWDEPYEVDS
jgi:hypothetical protein